jgi:hypothetical protein
MQVAIGYDFYYSIYNIPYLHKESSSSINTSSSLLIRPFLWMSRPLVALYLSAVEDRIKMDRFSFLRFFLNNQPDALIIQIYFVIKLYMFRASSLPIIRSSVP